MSTIGSLQVNIVAVTDKFMKGLNTAANMMRGFLGRVGKFSSSLTGMVESFISVKGLIAAAAGLLINSSLEAGHSMLALSKKLHLTVEEVSALHFAAEQLGISSEAVDIGIQRMAITLGKALNGSKEAVIAFADLGINYRELSKLPRLQQFFSVLEALHKLPDAEKRAAFAQVIFGKGAKNLAGAMELGTAAIVEQGQKAANLNAIMGTDTAESLSKAEESVKSLSRTWGAFKDQAVAIFGPVIEAVTWLGTKGLLLIRGLGYVTQLFFIGLGELASRTLLGIEQAANLVLPKFAQFDTEKMKSYVDSFQSAGMERGKLLDSMADQLIGTAQPQTNPLQAPKAADEVAKNTAATNDSLQQLIAIMKGEGGAQPTPTIQLATAGMR